MQKYTTGRCLHNNLPTGIGQTALLFLEQWLRVIILYICEVRSLESLTEEVCKNASHAAGNKWKGGWVYNGRINTKPISLSTQQCHSVLQDFSSTEKQSLYDSTVPRWGLAQESLVSNCTTISLIQARRWMMGYQCINLICRTMELKIIVGQAVTICVLLHSLWVDQAPRQNKWCLWGWKLRRDAPDVHSPSDVSSPASTRPWRQ